MRLPYASEKEVTDIGYPTYPNNTDLNSSAFEPTCKEAYICVPEIRDLSFKVTAKDGKSILVKDVLDAIERFLCWKIDVERYMGDMIDPVIREKLTTAAEKRIELYARGGNSNRVSHKGWKLVDRLGEDYLFAGLSPLYKTSDGKDWWTLHVNREAER